MLDLLGLKGLPDHKIRIEATGHDSMREYEQYKFQLIREGGDACSLYSYHAVQSEC